MSRGGRPGLPVPSTVHVRTWSLWTESNSEEEGKRAADDWLMGRQGPTGHHQPGKQKGVTASAGGEWSVVWDKGHASSALCHGHILRAEQAVRLPWAG